MKKFIISSLLVFSLFAFQLSNVQAASVQGWKFVNSNWYYYTSSHTTYKGWLFDRGHWYYLDSNGKMKTGWYQENGKWYYLNLKTGAMRTGWQSTQWGWFYLNQSGVMQTGWIKDHSKWYFLDEKGRMQVGMVSDGGYSYFLDYFEGMKSTGWFIGYNSYMYAYPDGKIAQSTMVDDTYYVDDRGNWIPSKNLETYYKPLKQAVETNGAGLGVYYGGGIAIDHLFLSLDVAMGNDYVFGYSYTPGKENDFDFTHITGPADSKYTSLIVDSAIALGCPLDKHGLTDLITQSLTQGGNSTEGSVTVTTSKYSIAIDW